jgi:putative Mg2+ transporter-C (MgtC) family protein
MDFLHLQTFANFLRAEVLVPNIHISFNMICALFLGLLVGYERTYRGRAAGMRTYALVSVASCAAVSVVGYPSLWYNGINPIPYGGADPTRIIQGIVSGIGFLGAGVIMRSGLNISGLTTAASIWAVSVIGILVGLGFYEGAFMLTLLCFGAMMWGAKIETFLPFCMAISVDMRIDKKYPPTEEKLNSIVSKQGYVIARGSFGVREDKDFYEWSFVVVSSGKKKKNVTIIGLSQALANVEGVQNFKLDYSRN